MSFGRSQTSFLISTHKLENSGFSSFGSIETRGTHTMSVKPVEIPAKNANGLYARIPEVNLTPAELAIYDSFTDPFKILFTISYVFTSLSKGNKLRKDAAKQTRLLVRFPDDATLLREVFTQNALEEFKKLVSFVVQSFSNLAFFFFNKNLNLLSYAFSFSPFSLSHSLFIFFFLSLLAHVSLASRPARWRFSKPPNLFKLSTDARFQAHAQGLVTEEFVSKLL